MRQLKVVSLFSGGGGLDIGFKWEGFDIIWANDVDAEACETYKANVDRHIVEGSISDIEVSDVPEADVVIGGPPCQSYSMIGKRNPEDTRGVMIWEFVRVVERIEPTVFLMENVTGLRSARWKNGLKVIDEILRVFNKDLGYSVNPVVLNAANFGVPQMRRRLFLIGFKGNRKLEPPVPTHVDMGGKKGENGWQKKLDRELGKWVSVEEAIGDLPLPCEEKEESVDYNEPPSSEYQEWAREKVRSGEPVYNHWMPQMSELDKVIIKHVPPGGNYMDIPDTVASERIRKYKKTGGRTTTYGRMRPNRPSYTLNTYFSRPNVGCNIHYSQDRLITIREGLRLQSFPDDFHLPAGLTKRGQYKLVGNAVPPLLAKALARSIIEQLLNFI